MQKIFNSKLILLVFVIIIAIRTQITIAQPIPPLKVLIDCSDEPDTQEWSERIATFLKVQYPFLVAMLDSEGYKPEEVIRLIIKRDISAAGSVRNFLFMSSKIFKEYPDDMGVTESIAVHELGHILQE